MHSQTGRGRVVLVGAGPGDPELITLRGLRELRSADVVVYDRLVDERLLDEAPSHAERIYAGKEPGRHSLSQDEINSILVDRAGRGLKVVRLKGGDPLTYGRGEEECLYVASHGIPCTIVPGVPSFTAAAARAMAPLGSRLGSSVFTVATGTRAGGAVNTAAARSLEYSDTLVLLMATRGLEEIAAEAARVRGWEAPAIAVVDATMPSERIIRTSLQGLVEAVREGTVRNPAVVIIGGAAGVSRRLHTVIHGPV